ncbi:MAG: SCO family protein, partial [Azonexus sp.]
MIRLLAALLAALLVCGPVAAQSAHNLLAGDDKEINPRYLLQDTNGRSVTSEDLRGRFQLIAFGYTY